MQQRDGNKIRILIKKKEAIPEKQDREHHTAKKDVSGSFLSCSMPCRHQTEMAVWIPDEVRKTVVFFTDLEDSRNRFRAEAPKQIPAKHPGINPGKWRRDQKNFDSA